MTEERIKLLEEEKKKIKVLKKTMTVADIKEYIDRAIDTAFAQNIVIDTAEILKRALIDTKYMLDELEDRPKAKWEETDLWEDGIGDIMKCSNCGHNHLDNMNYCSSCGARMENEEDVEPHKESGEE